MEPEVNLECPWNVESLEDFLYYFCPECAERKHSRDDFLNHALSHHPLFNDYLIKFCVKKEQNDEYYYTDIDENHLDIVHNDNKTGALLLVLVQTKVIEKMRYDIR